VRALRVSTEYFHVLGVGPALGREFLPEENRTHEIGIRMALGATRRDLLADVVREGMRLTLMGTAAGLAFALGLTRILRTMLFEVSPTDPLTFIVVSLVLIIVALLASYLPARRATKVDPMVALRHE
jgi:putative ABC transport system permease protein